MSKKEEESEEEEEDSEDVKQTEEKPHQNVHENGEREVNEEEQEEGEHVVEVASQHLSETHVNQEAAEKVMTLSESLQAADVHLVSSTGLKPQETAAGCDVQQKQGESTTEQQDSTHKDDDDEPAESSSPDDGQESVFKPNSAVSSEAAKEIVEDVDHVEETNVAPEKAFGPPANPPPPPNAPQNNIKEETR